MTEASNGEKLKDILKDEPGAPKIVDRSTFQAELDALRVRGPHRSLPITRGSMDVTNNAVNSYDSTR
jgi:hypothetical protein